MRLTEHFTLQELTLSPTAERHGLENEPNDLERAHLRKLAETLETARTILDDKPILINSGFRCDKLNKLVRGAKTSAHLEGRAADFHCPSFGTPREVALALKKERHLLPDGLKVILEFDRWIHLQIPVRIPAREPQKFIEAYMSGRLTEYKVL